MWRVRRSGSRRQALEALGALEARTTIGPSGAGWRRERQLESQRNEPRKVLRIRLHNRIRVSHSVVPLVRYGPGRVIFCQRRGDRPWAPGVLSPYAFFDEGSLLGFDFADSVKAAFNSNISDFSVFGEQSGLLLSNKSLAFITNHDTERDGSTLNYKNGDTYTLATEFLLAYGYGKPEVYAGFAFSGHDDGPPSNAGGYVLNTDCTGNWVCTDRSEGIANLVDWHNYAGAAPVRNFYADGVNLLSFSRGNKAFITINNEATPQTHTFTTGLRAGIYCDIIHGTFSLNRDRARAMAANPDWHGFGGTCSGPTVTVNTAGTANITVPAMDSVAFDAGDLMRR